MTDVVSASLYKAHRYPAKIISHCVWLYHPFTLIFREVEEMVLESGIIISYETIRGWCPQVRAGLRRVCCVS